jgi:dCMP deaminase
MEPPNKHVASRLKHATLLHELSPCPRGKVGAVIYDPESYAIVSDGYNGPPRKGGRLCGGDCCARDEQKITSGTHGEIGCHHAEMNALLNALRLGHSTLGKHMIITCEPCLMCAKMIHHAGIVSVLYHARGYATFDGVDYLYQHIGAENVHVL